MAKKTGGPAFPVTDEHQMNKRGMTLRDYFAAQALAGICASPINPWTSLQPQESGAKMACSAYAIADAMLAEREE